MNRRLIINAFAASIATLATGQVSARPLHFLLEKKVIAYRAKIEAWAKSGDVVAMARAGFKTSDEALAGADWTSRHVAPVITAMLNNEASRKLSKLARDPAIANLTLLNSMGDVIGSARKPRDYNMGTTLPFTEAIYGGTWSANRSQLDPQVNRHVVGLSTPVIERNREIGVLYLLLHADN